MSRPPSRFWGSSTRKSWNTTGAPTGWSTTPKEPSQQHGQHVEYNLKPEGVDKTRVRFDVTVEPAGPVPAFIVKRASENVLDAAVKGLRDLVLGAGNPDDAD